VCAWLLPHALPATEHASNLQVAPKDVAHLLNQVGVYPRNSAELEAAKALHEQGKAIGEAALGPDHPDVAISLENLGWVLHDLGQLPEAKAHLERALTTVEAALGPDHHTTKRRRGNLRQIEQHFQTGLAPDTVS
jgi:Tfp pilus assembly protein PilF